VAHLRRGNDDAHAVAQEAIHVPTVTTTTPNSPPAATTAALAAQACRSRWRRGTREPLAGLLGSLLLRRWLGRRGGGDARAYGSW